MDNKISSHPPQKKTELDFIMEADKRKGRGGQQKEKETLPWKDSLVRPDVQKVFTVKLPEEYTIKIKYVSESSGKSQQKIVRDIILRNIDSILKENGIE